MFGHLRSRNNRSMEKRLDLELSADPTNAKRLRNELHRWLLSAGINGSTGHDVILAAVEAFANAARHPQERRSSRIGIHGCLSEDAVTLAVEDDGHWRQPDRARDSRGFGLALMKSFMTSVHINREPTGTRVVLRRDL
jgi:anti-sigma regulatory factor (Ser/Thr protein kinase)